MVNLEETLWWSLQRESRQLLLLNTLRVRTHCLSYLNSEMMNHPLPVALRALSLRLQAHCQWSLVGLAQLIQHVGTFSTSSIL